MYNSHPLPAQRVYPKSEEYDDELEEGEIREGEDELEEGEIREGNDKIENGETAEERPTYPSVPLPPEFWQRHSPILSINRARATEAQTRPNSQPETTQQHAQAAEQNRPLTTAIQAEKGYSLDLQIETTHQQLDNGQDVQDDINLKGKETQDEDKARWNDFVFEGTVQALLKQNGFGGDSYEEQSQGTKTGAANVKNASKKRKKDHDDDDYKDDSNEVGEIGEDYEDDKDGDYVEESDKPQSKRPAKNHGKRPPQKQAKTEGKKPPRQHSAKARVGRDNITLPVRGQTDWTVDNLPDILYTFKPTARHARRQEDLPMKESLYPDGPPLRDFSILPDRISSNVEEFRVEAWMRLDRRIQLRDITDRMHPFFRISNNTLQQRGVRFRQAFKLLAWGSGSRKTQQNENELTQEMQLNGMDPNANSTRGLTPGLIDPSLGEAGGRIPAPPQYKDKYEADNAVGTVLSAGLNPGTSGYNDPSGLSLSSSSNTNPEMSDYNDLGVLSLLTGSNTTIGASGYNNTSGLPLFSGYSNCTKLALSSGYDSTGFPLSSGYNGSTGLPLSSSYGPTGIPLSSGGNLDAGTTGDNGPTGLSSSAGLDVGTGTSNYNDTRGLFENNAEDYAVNEERDNIVNSIEDIPVELETHIPTSLDYPGSSSSLQAERPPGITEYDPWTQNAVPRDYPGHSTQDDGVQGITLADLDAIYGDADFGDFGYSHPTIVPDSAPPPPHHIDVLYAVTERESQLYNEALGHFGLDGTYYFQGDNIDMHPELEIFGYM